MAATDRGRTLTDGQRRAQLAIRARMLTDLIAMWLLLDAERLTETTPAWLEQTTRVVLRHREESARAAAEYYDAFREAETGETDHRAEPAEADAQVRARVRTSLLVTGPVELRRRVQSGQDVAEASAAALTKVSGAAGRHALEGGRATIARAVQSDARAIGFARVTGPNPCWWCAMMASRGPEYKTRKSAGEGRAQARSGREFVGDGDAKFHDHCACTVEAVFDGAADWPGDGRQFEQLWKDSTKGKAGRAAVSAFRQAVEQRAAALEVVDADPVVAPAPAVDPVVEPVAVAVDVDDEPVDERAAEEPAPPADVTTLTDEQLDEEFARAAEADDADALDVLLAEMDRRQAAEQEQGADVDVDEGQAAEEPAPAPEPVEPDPADEVAPEQAEQWAHYERLVADGVSDEEAFAAAFERNAERLRSEELIGKLRAEGYHGRNLEALTRAAWRDEVYRLYLAAEQDTRGHLLTRQAQNRGVDPRTLFTGPAHVARANASPELLEWWDTHGRPTYDQWVALLLGGSTGYTGSDGDRWLR